jgi:aldose 1-epimerase
MGVDLGKETLDNVFRLQKMPQHITQLMSKKTGASLFLEQSSLDFPFLVVFAPEGENCIAIEPMTANTDAFNTGDGIKVLAPGELFRLNVKIWYRKAEKTDF